MALSLGLITSDTCADIVYQSPDDYLHTAFSGAPPEPQFIWLRGDLRVKAENILGHPHRGLRIRYWQHAARTVWILDEIGKDKPITTGITIEDGAITDLSVLVFRESRGWEVRHEFFTRQFTNATRGRYGGLDRRIDSITGATLSVRALQKQAQLALLLEAEVRRSFGEQP